MKTPKAIPDAALTEITTKNLSRGEPTPKIEHRVMTITAYTKNDKGMDGRGITKSGEHVQEGITIAADQSIPFGSQISVPSLNKVFTVQDRGGAITGNRLDVYMESRKAALDFGVKRLDVYIKYP